MPFSETFLEKLSLKSKTNGHRESLLHLAGSSVGFPMGLITMGHDSSIVPLREKEQVKKK